MLASACNCGRSSIKSERVGADGGGGRGGEHEIEKGDGFYDNLTALAKKL